MVSYRWALACLHRYTRTVFLLSFFGSEDLKTSADDPFYRNYTTLMCPKSLTHDITTHLLSSLSENDVHTFSLSVILSFQLKRSTKNNEQKYKNKFFNKKFSDDVLSPRWCHWELLPFRCLCSACQPAGHVTNNKYMKKWWKAASHDFLTFIHSEHRHRPSVKDTLICVNVYHVVICQLSLKIFNFSS